jgi:hypothetical protein
MFQNFNRLRSKTQGGHPLKQYGFGVEKKCLTWKGTWVKTWLGYQKGLNFKISSGPLHLNML